jgi:hypothetical protein
MLLSMKKRRDIDTGRQDKKGRLRKRREGKERKGD